MKIEFAKPELDELFQTPLDALKGKRPYPVEVIKQFKKKILILISIQSLEGLKPFRSLNFEYLKGDRKGQCSIRLNDQYRLIFLPLEDDSIQVLIIKEISKHYE